MTHKEHNGYTNYETWLVSTWFQNEEGTMWYWEEQAAEAFRRCRTDKDTAASELANLMKEETEEASPCKDASFFTDLMNAALSEVNWYEIAQNYIESVIEDAEA